MGEMMISSKAGTTLPVADTLTSMVPRSTSDIISFLRSIEGIIIEPSQAPMPSTTTATDAAIAILRIFFLRCSLTGICLSIVSLSFFILFL